MIWINSDIRSSATQITLLWPLVAPDLHRVIVPEAWGYAHMQRLTLDKVFVERRVSGSKPLSGRPQGTAVLAALKPGDVVIIAKLDRMFRSTLDALDVLSRLKEGGINLHMID